MARIRTIKPEFFTSDDICSLSPYARLLYIGLWCEADREGLFEWKTRSFKRRYLPDDQLDIDSVCDELLSRGLVVLYGDGLACIPMFAKHQHINPREAASTLPHPDASITRAPRVIDASPRGSDVQGGREGKGREGSSDASKGTRLPADWKPTADELRWAVDARPDVQVNLEVEKFRDYWHGVTGAKATKRDWPATWRNWIRNAHGSGGQKSTVNHGDSPAAMRRL